MEGKVCIVTGASSGFGEAISVLLASRGAKVTLCGRDKLRLAAVRTRCMNAAGGHDDRFLTIGGDLTESEHRRVVVLSTVNKFGRVDVLIPNAGIVVPGDTLTDITEEDFDRLMDVNMKSVLFLIKETVPELAKTKGNIVITSSAGAHLPINTQLCYAMSKAAVDHMTTCFAVDLGPKGIRVNTVNPSFSPTRAAREFGDLDTVNKTIEPMERQQQVLSTRHVTPEDVAEATVFLASPSASFITGTSLKVDGGRALTGAPRHQE